MARTAFSALLIPALLVFALGFCGATEVTTYTFYNLNVTVNHPSQTVFSPGSTVEFNVTATNPEDYLFDGYLIVTQVYGCDIPNPYNYNFTDCDTTVHKTVTPIRIESGKAGTFQVSEKVPAGARPGTWRIDTYIMMNNSEVYGNYVSYAPRKFFAYKVTGSGNEPKVSVLRTKTHAAGGFAQSGPAVSQDGPMRGYVEMKNLDGAAFSGKLEISYCNFDDYMGECNVSETLDVSLPAGKSVGYQYQITDRLERGAYTVLYRLLEGDRLVTEYKNRLIVSGKTINVLAIDGAKESYTAGERPQVRVAFTGPYFPAIDSVDNITANTTVYDAKGSLVYTITENYPEIKSDELLVQQYAFTAKEDLAGYTACLDVAGEGASKKKCVSFGKVEAPQQPSPTPEASPTIQPTVQQSTPIASEAPISTPTGTPNRKDDTMTYAAIILAIAAIAAYWLFRNQKPPTAAAVLLLLMVLPFAHAVDCPTFQFNYDTNGNGVVDSGEPAVSVRSSGSIYYLPVNTIVTAPGQCSYTYATTAYTTSYETVSYCNHWCHNTASRCYATTISVQTPYTVINTGYYTHYVTVSGNVVTFTETRAFADNTTLLTKQALVDRIKNFTFTDLSFAVKANTSIYPGLVASSLPEFPFDDVENETTKVDQYIMYTVLHNYCSIPSNNCTYVNESSAYGVYTYKPYNYFIRNFTINNYVLRNLPINYTHQNGTLMQLRINYTLNNYAVTNYSVGGPLTGPYTINYTLRNYPYTYQVNATNIYSYALDEYTIPAYTITGYVVDQYQNSTSYYVKWESLFNDLSENNLIGGIVTVSATRTSSGTSVLATNARAYKIQNPGLYYLAHTYA